MLKDIVPEIGIKRLQREKATQAIYAQIQKTEEIVRDGCMDCVKKHLAQAIILMQEVLQGYSEDPHMHKWLAIGHLAEAADEALADNPELANEIRNLRLKVMGQKQ